MHFRQVFGQVFGVETTIAEVVFGSVLAVMAVAFVLSWRRGRRGRPAARKAKANRLELGYVTALAGIAAFLITLSFTSNASFFTTTTAFHRDPPPALVVRVLAFQWCWDFQYPHGVSVSARCAGGRVPTLMLPSGEPVKIDLTSRDVVHSFWVPALKFKMDIFPGHVNSFTFTLPDGRWWARCAEFCGLYHYGMEFYIKAVPRARFDRWLTGMARSVQAGSTP